MRLEIIPASETFGATAIGVDLRTEPALETVAAIREAWLCHQVLSFPGQSLSLEEFERFAATIGAFGHDPYFHNLPGHPHIAEVRRDADEATPIFAETWHSDWSFLATPPSATLLFGVVVPPVGGDTLFANQYAAWETLPAETRALLNGKIGIHSARRGYAPGGLYGANDKGRSMAIRYSEDAMATCLHPIVRRHPETGKDTLFVNPGYTIGIDGMPEDEATSLLAELFDHQTREEFIYRHRWSADMVVIWDNRCLLHAATGGYDGYARLLHRITVA